MAKKSLTRLGIMLMLGAAIFQASCGTILYPERRGQPHGRLDIGVVALDGIGLILFLVPGIIAFAVDFATGAIYLPPEPSYGGAMFGKAAHEIRVDPAELTTQKVEEIVREQTGRKVNLEPGSYRAMPLKSLDDLSPDSVAGLEAETRPAQVIFRASDR
jgi:hypothetical protein